MEHITFAVTQVPIAAMKMMLRVVMVLHSNQLATERPDWPLTMVMKCRTPRVMSDPPLTMRNMLTGNGGGGGIVAFIAHVICCCIGFPVTFVASICVIASLAILDVMTYLALLALMHMMVVMMVMMMLLIRGK